MRYIRSEQSSNGDAIEHIILDLSGKICPTLCIIVVENSIVQEQK